MSPKFVRHGGRIYLDELEVENDIRRRAGVPLIDTCSASHRLLPLAEAARRYGVSTRTMKRREAAARAAEVDDKAA